MFPLKQRKIDGYKFGVPTFYSTYHLGVDYKADSTEVFAPFSGTIVQAYPALQTPAGGNTIWFKPTGQDVVIRFLHLKTFKVIKGQQVTEGQLIAISGNTGTSTKPHIHIDVSKGTVNLNDRKNFIDPEFFNWITTPPMPQPIYPIDIRIKAVINSPVPWLSAEQELAEVATWYWVNSGGKLRLFFEVTYSNFTNIPFRVFPNDGTATIDEAWFDANVLDSAYHNTTFIVRPEDLPSGYPGGYKLVGRTTGYYGKLPTKTIIACGENEASPTYPAVNNFVDLMRHELMHSCYIWAGSFIYHAPPAQDEYFGSDQTHKYFFLPTWLPPNQGLGQPEGAFSELNYSNIYITITKGDIMSNAIFVKKANSMEAGFYLPATSEDALKDKALNLGLNILKPDGSIDFNKAKTISGL